MLFNCSCKVQINQVWVCKACLDQNPKSFAACLLPQVWLHLILATIHDVHLITLRALMGHYVIIHTQLFAGYTCSLNAVDNEGQLLE